MAISRIGIQMQNATPAAMHHASFLPGVKGINTIECLKPGNCQREAIKVFRLWLPDETLGALMRGELDGRWLARECLSWLNGLGRNDPLFYIQPWNEKAQRLGEGFERVVQILKECVAVLHAEGYKVTGPAFSTGVPDDPWNGDWRTWDYFAANGFCDLDSLMLNQYWGNAGLTLGNALRHRIIHEHFKGKHPWIFLGEAGRDEIEGGGRGWKASNVTAAQYLEEIRGFAIEVAKDKYVPIVFLFEDAPNNPFHDFNIEDFDLSEFAGLPVFEQEEGGEMPIKEEDLARVEGALIKEALDVHVRLNEAKDNPGATFEAMMSQMGRELDSAFSEGGQVVNKIREEFAELRKKL